LCISHQWVQWDNFDEVLILVLYAVRERRKSGQREKFTTHSLTKRGRKQNRERKREVERQPGKK